MYLATAVHLVGSRPMDVVVGKVDILPAHILGGRQRTSDLNQCGVKKMNRVI